MSIISPVAHLKLRLDLPTYSLGTTTRYSVHVPVGLFSTPPPFILHHTSTGQTSPEAQTGMLLLRSGPRAPSPRRNLISLSSDADYYSFTRPILPVPELGYVQRRGCASVACR
jgi:hypothetical protein